MGAGFAGLLHLERLPTAAASPNIGAGFAGLLHLERLPTAAASHILFLSNSFFPITIRWISLVPSPISSSGASR
jgi:hypothetical protein